MVHRIALVLLLVLVTPALSAAAVVTETVGDTVRVGADDKININTAGVKDLMTLSGVGRSLAEKIVKYRDEHGLFKKPNDLRKVDGVGAALWEKNRERIVVK
jgi:competence protein ComEA